MVTRYDLDPAQAESQMEAHSAACQVAEREVDEARERCDDLERQIDEADESEPAELLAELERAEHVLEDAEQGYGTAVNSAGEDQRFWYEEEIDEGGF